MKWRAVELDEVPELRGARHADRLLVLESAIVVVEETSRPKSEDLEKLESTVRALREGLLDERVSRANPSLDPRSARVVAVIHAKRRVDAPVYKMALTAKVGAPVIVAGCDRELRAKLAKLLGARRA